VLNNILTGNSIGVFLNGSNNTVRQNLITDNNGGGASSGSGIYSDAGSNGLTIDNNRFAPGGGAAHANASIIFTGGPPVVQTNINITNNQFVGDNEIFLLNTTNVTVTGNTFQGSLFHGVDVSGANSNVLVQNNLINGVGFSAVRIHDPGAVGANADIRVLGNLLFGSGDFGVNATDTIGGTNLVNFNRIVGSVSGGLSNTATGPLLNAENNFWGCNAGPISAGCDTATGNVDFNPWLVLSISAAPTSIFTGATSTIAGDVTRNSNNQDTSALGHIPDGTVITFSTTLGTVNPTSAGTVNGRATTTLTAPATTGTATVSDQLDNATASLTVTITQGPRAPVANNDTAATAQGVPVTVNVLANDTDPDNDIVPSTVTVVTPPSSGTASVNATTGAITYAPTATFTGTVTFTYTVRDAAGNTSNAATVTVTVGVGSADLRIAKSGPVNVTDGTNVVYTITVSNAGPNQADNVTVTDPAPTQLTFQSNTGACTTAFPCALGSIPSGQSRTITATFSVPSGYSGPNPIVNTATVASSTADPDATNNTATARTPVQSAGTISDANNDDHEEKQDEKPKETEDQRRHRERTNQSGRSDVSIEGTVVAVERAPALNSLLVTIAMTRGETQVVQVFCYSASGAVNCPDIQVGDYLEADGYQNGVGDPNTYFVAADGVEVTRNGKKGK
jgi:uncharacterized repeat protein (TIGR01451 family)